MNNAALLQIINQESAGLEKYLAGYLRNFRGIVPAITGFIKKNRNKKGVLVVARLGAKKIDSILKASGIERITSEMRPYLARAASGALKPYKTLGTAANVSDRALASILANSYDDIRLSMSRSVAGFRAVLKQELLTAAFVPRPLGTSAAVLSKAMSITKGQAATIFRTTTAQVQRSIQIAALEKFDPGDAFVLYAGSIKKNTRAFCKVLSGLAIRREDLGKLDNGQGLSVATSCGGYNCRHRLLAVSGDFVEMNGIDIAKGADISRANNVAKRG